MSSSLEKNISITKPVSLETVPIPTVLKEGQKIESQQFKNLLEFMGYKQALELYTELKELEQGELKDSKLRDENGELILVWHGSPRKFEEFKAEAKGEWRWRNKGVHFSSSKKVTEQYAEKAQTALNQMLYDIAIEITGLEYGSKLEKEHITQTYAAYNEMVKDLIEHGEDSRFYHKAYYHSGHGDKTGERRPDFDYLKFKGRRFGLDWALEPFGGELPTKDNTSFNEKKRLYLGNGIGKYQYVGVLNIKKPFSTDEAENIDIAFEKGEKLHAEEGTDGTILFHKEAVVDAQGGLVEATKGTYSAGVFDVGNIKVIGRIEEGNFVKI